MMSARLSRLLVTRKPLVMKKMSTAMSPRVMPRLSRPGSAVGVPLEMAKLWLKTTASAAIMRIRLRLLFLPPT